LDHRRWPTEEELKRRMSLALEQPSVIKEINSRRRVEGIGTFASETVECELGDGSKLMVFCKHFHFGPEESGARESDRFYEISVYRRVLRDIPLTLPAFLGAWTDSASGEALMLLEYLEDATRVTLPADYRTMMERAAAWSASFHRKAAELLESSDLSFLEAFELDVFPSRCQSLVAAIPAELGGGNRGWIERLTERFDAVLEIVRSAPVTVIHGEYYPQNVLQRNQMIYPVDWETARLGMGEMDLAMLLEGDWGPSDVVERCVTAYARERSGAHDMRAVRKRFIAGQVLMAVHWLSLYPDIAPDADGEMRQPWRLRRLESGARELGII
jgi:hypothetical protein